MASNVRSFFSNIRHNIDTRRDKDNSKILDENFVAKNQRLVQLEPALKALKKGFQSSLVGGLDEDKKLKKLNEHLLHQTLLEVGNALRPTKDSESALSGSCSIASELMSGLASQRLIYEEQIISKVITPLTQLLDDDFRKVSKGRRLMKNLANEFDSIQSKFQNAERSSGQNTSALAQKVDTLSQDLEDARLSYERQKDELSSDIASLVSMEPDMAKCLLEYVRLQRDYHHTSLFDIEESLSKLEDFIASSCVPPVFGMSLSEHLHTSNRQISYVIEVCVCLLIKYGLEEEGLFRIAGSQVKVKRLKNSLDKQNLWLSECVGDIHCVAGVLKQYLRQLPDPLLTSDLYENWKQAATLQGGDRLQAMWSVSRQLPKENFDNLGYLMKFLFMLSQQQDSNKMSPSNLAIVLAPNLLWDPLCPSDVMTTTQMMGAGVEAMITHADWFFSDAIHYRVDEIILSLNGSPTASVEHTPPLTRAVPENKAVEKKLETDIVEEINESILPQALPSRKFEDSETPEREIATLSSTEGLGAGSSPSRHRRSNSDGKVLWDTDRSSSPRPAKKRAPPRPVRPDRPAPPPPPAKSSEKLFHEGLEISSTSETFLDASRLSLSSNVSSTSVANTSYSDIHNPLSPFDLSPPPDCSSDGAAASRDDGSNYRILRATANKPTTISASIAELEIAEKDAPSRPPPPAKYTFECDDVEDERPDEKHLYPGKSLMEFAYFEPETPSERQFGRRNTHQLTKARLVPAYDSSTLPPRRPQRPASMMIKRSDASARSQAIYDKDELLSSGITNTGFASPRSQPSSSSFSKEQSPINSSITPDVCLSPTSLGFTNADSRDASTSPCVSRHTKL